MKTKYNSNLQKAIGAPTTVEAMTWERGKIVVECIKAQAVCISGVVWYNANENTLKVVKEFVEKIRWFWRHKCIICDIDIPTGIEKRKKHYVAWQLWYKIEKPVTKRSDFVPYLDKYFEIGDEFLQYFSQLAQEYKFDML